MLHTLTGRIDHQINLSGHDQINNIMLVHSNFMSSNGRNLMIIKIFRRTLCCINRPAQIIKSLGNRKDFGLITVLDRNNNAAILDHMRSGAVKRLDQRLIIGAGNSKNFTGGFHFGSQVDISTMNFLKREDRHLDGNVIMRFLKAILIAHLRQCVSEEGAHCQRHNRDSGDFADIRNRSGRSRVCLNDIDNFIFHNELNIKKSFNL